MNDRERHRQFIERLDRSRPATFRAAEWLHKKGYNITIPAIQYRPFEEAPDKYLDSGDMFIEKDGKTYRVEIKHSGYDFTDKNSWKFKSMLVSNKAAVERNKDSIGYIIINKPMTHMAIIWNKTRNYWFEEAKFASNTQKVEQFYLCPLEYIDFRNMTND